MAFCLLDCDRLRLAYARNREAHFFPARSRADFRCRPGGRDDLCIPACLAWGISVGRRRLYHQQRIINCAARLAADLVFPRFPVAVFPAHLQHISHRARVVGPKHDWLSLGEPSASCWQCSSGMGGAGAVRSTRLVVSCGNFCATSGAGRVSGMDYRTQERADGLFLFADAACLDCVC